MTTPRWTDERVEKIIGALLQTGVLLAGVTVLLGGVLYLVQYGRGPASYGTFRAERAAMYSLRAVIVGAFHLDSRSVIELGVLLLIATPVIRVAFSVAAFALQKDAIYVTVTLIVFAILLFSLFGTP